MDSEFNTAGKTDLGLSSDLEARKKKFFSFLKRSQLWVLFILVIAILLGVYLRSLPMMDHSQGIPSFSRFLFTPGDAYSGKPGLWDITTNTWTLGPDLDPWLFLRSAKTIVEQGDLPEIDKMRFVPVGFDNSKESKLLPYLIVLTHKIFTSLGFNTSVEFAGVVFPVIMFALTIISFFLFVREVFIEPTQEERLKANCIAIIATLFMITIPVFLSRTVAGIPEKESAAFFFMFLTFYFFLKAWKSEKIYFNLIFGALAGIATALMALIWGGVLYAFIPMGISVLLAFVVNKVHRKEFLAYLMWVIFSFAITMYFSKRYDIEEMFTSLSSGIAFFTLFILFVHAGLYKTKLSKIKFLHESKIPKTILSIIIGIVLIIILASIFMGPSIIIEKIKVVHQTIFKPVFGRWNITVAENKQPDFLEWSGSLGPHFRGIPLFFWMFFIGSIVLFKKMTNHLQKKDSWRLTGAFVLFLVGMIFSRYSGDSIFNGENFISKTFYYLSALIFIGSIIYYYSQYHNRHDTSFEKIKFDYILVIALLVITVFTARGAVRLIMVLGPIAPIFAGFLLVETYSSFSRSKDSRKMVLGVVLIVLVVASLYSFYVFYNSTKVQAYSYVPSSYNIQWQKAMDWVRTNTTEDAVFAHWWDYGYWVQSIGNRATVTDGGNAIVYWNYLTGRHVLTGDNEKDALEFLYNHNVTHFLIDSTDIGKYTAFSSIGSDLNYDRYSWIATFLLDEKQTRETRNQTIYAYTGGVSLDEDLVIEQDGNEIFLPKGSAGVGAILIPQNAQGMYEQPYIITVYQGQQNKINLRYLHINGKLQDFKTGIEAAAFVFPRLDPQGQGVSKNDIGAAMFISPRLFRGFLSQVYIMNDPLNKYPHFKLAHSEDALIIDDLKARGMALNDFVYYNGVYGPIKIWEVEYTGQEQIKQEYQDTDETKYLEWQL